MADYHTFVLVFAPAADPGLLKRLLATLTEADSDFPRNDIGPSGVARGGGKEEIEGEAACTWRNPVIERQRFVDLLEDSGLSGYGLLYNRAADGFYRPDYSADDCFTFGSYGCSPSDWQAVVAALAQAKAVGPLLEVRLRAALPILASIAARTGVTVAGLTNGKLAAYKARLAATSAPSDIETLTDLIALAEAQAPRWRRGEPPINCFVYRQGFSEKDGEPVFVDSDGDWHRGVLDLGGRAWGDAGWAPLGGLPS